jgi:hypothetical protein
MPKIHFQNLNSENLFIEFRPLWQTFKLCDSITNTNLKYFDEPVNGMEGCVLTFYPNYNQPNPDSMKIVKIDSIRFSFMEALGYDKIAHYNVFFNLANIKVTLPSNLNK